MPLVMSCSKLAGGAAQSGPHQEPGIDQQQRAEPDPDDVVPVIVAGTRERRHGEPGRARQRRAERRRTEPVRREADDEGRPGDQALGGPADA